MTGFHGGAYISGGKGFESGLKSWGLTVDGHPGFVRYVFKIVISEEEVDQVAQNFFDPQHDVQVDVLATIFDQFREVVEVRDRG